MKLTQGENMSIEYYIHIFIYLVFSIRNHHQRYTHLSIHFFQNTTKTYWNGKW